MKKHTLLLIGIALIGQSILVVAQPGYWGGPGYYGYGYYGYGPGYYGGYGPGYYSRNAAIATGVGFGVSSLIGAAAADSDSRRARRERQEQVRENRKLKEENRRLRRDNTQQTLQSKHRVQRNTNTNNPNYRNNSDRHDARQYIEEEDNAV
ncbi:MAG: hypothetical protein NT124_03425 [Candidatus Dependentiae bacterium]|nr:hypothetical protein [Candidatus Dependentiae bacterium]